MLIVATDIDGVELVHRADGEPPIAQLSAPRATGFHRWGLRYRDGGHPEAPFTGPFNVAPRTREAAIADVAYCIRVCSDYQLGLA